MKRRGQVAGLLGECNSLHDFSSAMKLLVEAGLPSEWGVFMRGQDRPLWRLENFGGMPGNFVACRWRMTVGGLAFV